jgi:hypothetical protein
MLVHHACKNNAGLQNHLMPFSVWVLMNTITVLQLFGNHWDAALGAVARKLNILHFRIYTLQSEQSVVQNHGAIKTRAYPTDGTVSHSRI